MMTAVADRHDVTIELTHIPFNNCRERIFTSSSFRHSA
jgi:hypothetical protein